MIRKLFYLVSVFMVVGLIGPAAAQDVDMEIGFGTPVIDGQVDDIWADASVASFVPLDDPANGSGTWMALYDSENLYVLVDITDDSLQNDSADSWLDDSVELYFDGGNTKLNTALAGDDHQFSFGWTADDIQGTNIAGYTEGIEQAQATTDTGWRIEIKMPWLSIQGAAPMAGDLIGIDCYYNDDDDGGDSRENKMLGFSAVEGWNDASQWGTAILGAIPIHKPVDPGADGLVVYYALENDVNDSSGNGLDGTIVGDPNFVDGLEGMALDFNGDDYVDCGTNDVLNNLSDAMTVSAWVNIRSVTTGWMGIVMKGETAWRLGVNNESTGIHFGFTGGTRGWQAANSVTELPFDEWHHIAGTYDRSVGGTVHVDGIAETVNPDPNGVATNEMPLFLGENPESLGRLFDGMLDEVKIYDRALSEGEMLYISGNRNLALNPSFEEDEDILDDPNWYSWGTWNPDEGAGSNAYIVDTDSVDGARSLRIEPVGAENWYFIVISLPIPVDMDKVYTTSFYAKAEAPRPLTVQMKAEDNSISEWSSTTFELTTEWAEYSFTSEVLIDTIKLELLCAGSEVPFLLDSVTVFMSGNAPPPDVPDVPDVPLVPGENILVNGGFEDGVMEPWTTYGNVTTEVVTELTDATVPEAPVEGAYCLHVVVPEAGANSWDAGLQSAGHVFEAGKQYTMSANVKSKAGTLDIHFKPERAADPWEGYNDTTFTMTEEWTEFSVETGVIPADVDPASITFHIGFAAGDFWVDDVKFSELVEE